jgi:two-component sensor histidine kinase
VSSLVSVAFATRSPEIVSRPEKPVSAARVASADDLAAFRQLPHQTKNALQRILCEIVRAADVHDTPELRAAFADLERRVSLTAKISDALFGFTDAPGPLADRLRALCQAMVACLAASGQDITWDVVVTGDCPESQATTLVRVAHEMLGNALCHGLASHPRGRIAVRVMQHPQGIRLAVSDDGVGLRERGEDGAGLRLMEELAREHAGSVTLRRRGPLTVAELDLPRP